MKDSRSSDRDDDDEAPRPQLLWRPAARLGSGLAVAVAAFVETCARLRSKEPPPITDLERARRARAARLLFRRSRPDLRD